MAGRIEAGPGERAEGGAVELSAKIISPPNVPSTFSSVKSPLNSGRMVDVALVASGGAPGRGQSVMSTSQVPDIAVSLACSAS